MEFFLLKTHIYIVPYVLGGQDPDAVQDIFYLYTVSTGEWTQMPELPGPRALMGCGMVQDLEGEPKLVITGGIEDLSTYIFDFGTGWVTV